MPNDHTKNSSVQSNNNNTSIHSYFFQPKDYLSVLKKGVSKEEQQKFIQSVNTRLKEALTAGENFDEKSDWITITRYLDYQFFLMLVRGLDEVVQEKMLLSKTQSGSTFAHDIVHYKGACAFDWILMACRFTFQQQIVQLIDHTGSSVAHLVAKDPTPEIFLSQMWVICLGADTKENLITLQDNDGWTLMHTLARYKDDEAVEYVWVRLRKAIQEKLLTMKTNDGLTIPELIASYRNFSEEERKEMGLVS